MFRGRFQRRLVSSIAYGPVMAVLGVYCAPGRLPEIFGIPLTYEAGELTLYRVGYTGLGGDVDPLTRDLRMTEHSLTKLSQDAAYQLIKDGIYRAEYGDVEVVTIQLLSN